MAKRISGKMDPDVKAQWVEALRSGKYQQTKGHLHTERGYCCLGVLTEVIEGEGCWQSPQRGVFADAERIFCPKKTHGMELVDNAFPPVRIGRVSGLGGLEYDDHNCERMPVMDRLAMYNDEGRSFKWIASYIERYL